MVPSTPAKRVRDDAEGVDVVVVIMLLSRSCAFDPVVTPEPKYQERCDEDDDEEDDAHG